MDEFFDMGGYAPYVWGSYGIAFAVMFWMLGTTIWQARK